MPHGAPQRTWQVLETKVRLPRTVGWGHGSPSGFASVFSIPGHASPLREPQSRQHQSHNKSTTRVDHHVACPRTGARTPGQDRRACLGPHGMRSRRSRRAGRPAAVAHAHDRPGWHHITAADSTWSSTASLLGKGHSMPRDENGVALAGRGYVPQTGHIPGVAAQRSPAPCRTRLGGWGPPLGAR